MVLDIHIVYRSPNSSSKNNASLCSLINEMRGTFIIIGDFNFPGICWGTGRSDTQSRDFYKVIKDNFLLIDEPTHRSGNILDLVISKDERLMKNVEYEGRLGKSDHDIMSSQYDRYLSMV